MGGGSITIKSPQEININEVDSIILGTFTGLDELSRQLIDMGIDKNKIDKSHIEQSVLSRIAFLQDFAKVVYDRGIQGNVAELGVYRGDFARHINEFFYDRKLYLFDTFSGFETKDIAKERQDGLSKENISHFSNTSINLVLSKMPIAQNCIIKQGWFPQSAVGVDERFCFVNLDADLYEPILAGLEFFYPKMELGGVILIHEYFSLGYKGVKKAVDEFITRNNILPIPIGDSLSIAILKT